MKKLILSCLTVIVLSIPSWGQHATAPSLQGDEDTKSAMELGLGSGVDYGGLGIQLAYLPVKALSIFGGLGYNILGLGYNLGVKGRILPNNKFTPTVSLMYGYNGVIVVKGAPEYDKTYYGLSGGVGLEIRFQNHRGAGRSVNLGLLYLGKGQQFYDDWDKVRRDPFVEIQQEPSPISFSVGYHFMF